MSFLFRGFDGDKQPFLEAQISLRQRKPKAPNRDISVLLPSCGLGRWLPSIEIQKEAVFADNGGIA